ncbi:MULTISPECIES: hypothetical protein [unclassified Pseudomonas]|uniref:hypothetical protein n=1 Tax=unclassified Pseudomonas TaxID=196821 RepID=UPI002AC8AB52|nr:MULTISPECIES: hypothetical protein [unclassified Pseudomonas]MEB0045524.1 hypothetical protein [Pseudomonas sp. Dout3]MEB0095407.1 hypothetical protein [Pseudomonas sp. DC1.2]WPX60991.1 hypothetical protein RHM68_10280 [Pseudomonas sp. DC1.2]
MKNGAVWDFHTTAVGSYRGALVYIWEGVGNQLEDVPVMFESYDELMNWAYGEGIVTTDLYISRCGDRKAISLRSNDLQSTYCGVPQLWVNARWGQYRTAFKYWLGANRSGSSIHELHRSAVQVFTNLNSALLSKSIFKNLSDDFRLKAKLIVDAEISANNAAANTASGDPALIEKFDSFLDADHLVHKASLRNLPNAWVLLGPVHADVNRNYGRLVEKKLPRSKVGVGRINLNALMGFKVFAPFMPLTSAEVANCVQMMGGGFSTSTHLAAQLPLMADQVSAFVRYPGFKAK